MIFRVNTEDCLKYDFRWWDIDPMPRCWWVVCRQILIPECTVSNTQVAFLMGGGKQIFEGMSSFRGVLKRTWRKLAPNWDEAVFWETGFRFRGACAQTTTFRRNSDALCAGFRRMERKTRLTEPFFRECFSRSLKSNKTCMAGGRGPHGHTANMEAASGRHGWAQKSNFNFWKSKQVHSLSKNASVKTKLKFLTNSHWSFTQTLHFACEHLRELCKLIQLAAKVRPVQTKLQCLTSSQAWLCVNCN